MANYKIKSNLSEKQVELDVSRYFGWITPEGREPFRLLDVDENITGADTLFYEGVFPLYLQFKKSEGLHSINSIPSSNRINKSKLEDIRDFRNNLNLDGDPILYFQLRKMAKNAVDYQHNILMQYANTGFSNAIYVAPLTLDKNEYSRTLFDSVGRYRLEPFYNRNITIRQRGWLSYIGSIPFLREHVSIIPHERVNTNEHYYSFSPNGTDIAWHSDVLINSQPSRLSDFLYNLFIDILSSKIEVLSLEHLSIRLSQTSVFLKTFLEIKNKSPIEIIQKHGNLLREKYDIRQILLFLNNKQIIRQSL